MGLLGNKEDKDGSNADTSREGKVKIIPFNPLWSKIASFNLLIIVIILMIEIMCIFRDFFFRSFSYFYNIFNNLYYTNIGPLNQFTFVLVIFSILLVIDILLYFTKLKKPKFDEWMVDLAVKHLSSEYIWYKKNILKVDFDRNLNKKDVMEFITELSNKSTRYTYYFNNLDFNQGAASITVTKQQKVPDRAELDIEKDDTAWNVIPLGLAVNHKLKKVTPVCWWLNDNIKRKDVMITNPSTSILISGGTGSGKSVLQQCIVGHISRYPDHFMMVGCDVKMVEFNDFIGVSSVKKVALTLEEVGDAVEQAKDLMYERFNFMKENHKNNIYKVDAEVDCYIIKSKDGSTKQYQFDEIFSCFINDESKLLKIESIYREVMNNSNVKIDTAYEDVGCSLLTKDNISKSKCKYSPKAMVIMIDEMTEVMSGSNYKIVSKIQENIGSIARLGRAAGCHLVLATQRPSSNVINADLKNNIQQSVLLGGFDSGISSLVFDVDISHMSKPEIKGRGFVKAGKDLIEFQSYWTEPKRDFHYNKTNEYENENNETEEIEEDLKEENFNEEDFFEPNKDIVLTDNKNETIIDKKVSASIDWGDDEDLVLTTPKENLQNSEITSDKFSNRKINLNLNNELYKSTDNTNIPSNKNDNFNDLTNTGGKLLKLNLNKNDVNNSKKVLKLNRNS